jgi:hypothetical protein
MRNLGDLDLLLLWERSTHRHALDRSALLCAWARPELPVDTIPDLPLGETTEILLRLRAACFGERISAHVDCGRCSERLQLSVSIHELLRDDSSLVSHEVDAAGERWRLPTLRDLAAVARERDAEQAVSGLMARCRLNGVDEDAQQPLSETNLMEVEAALEAADPNADLVFDVRCGACGHVGTTQLDAGELLWEEIDARARALLNEVHLLARAYGWSEREILALSASRRAFYLSTVLS